MSRKSNAKSKKKFKVWYWLFYALLAGLLAYAVVSQFAHFKRGVEALTLADPGLVLLGLTLMAVTFFLAAAVYCLLALHRLAYLKTVVIELASALITRLLPAGIGGLGLHGDYLYRQKHSAAEASAVASVNDALGILANLTILAVVLVFWPGQLDFSGFKLSPGVVTAIVVAVIVAAVIILSIRRVRLAVTGFLRNFGRSLRIYARLPYKLLLAFGLAVIMALIYALILLLSAHAVGISLPFTPVFVTFAIGTLVGAATPTPGGLVGVEAGLFAGFTAYGVAATPALAAVLLYRLLTYWTPMIPGLVAFIAARRAKYI